MHPARWLILGLLLSLAMAWPLALSPVAPADPPSDRVAHQPPFGTLADPGILVDVDTPADMAMLTG